MTHHSTGIAALDEVLGGGFVPGNVLLLEGPPGVGRSTLMLQACDGFARDGRKACYFSVEMSSCDVLYCVARLGIKNNNLFIFSDMQGIDDYVSDNGIMKGDCLLVVDSLNIFGADGNTGSMDAAVEYLFAFAKYKKVAVVAIVTLENGKSSVTDRMKHLVNGVVCLDPKLDEGVEYTTVREISMSEKNRQGPSGARALVELTEKGFR